VALLRGGGAAGGGRAESAGQAIPCSTDAHLDDRERPRLLLCLGPRIQAACARASAASCRAAEALSDGRGVRASDDRGAQGNLDRSCDLQWPPAPFSSRARASSTRMPAACSPASVSAAPTAACGMASSRRRVAIVSACCAVASWGATG